MPFADRQQIHDALAYYTRFCSTDQEPPALPTPMATILVRTLLGAALAICGGLAAWLVPGLHAGRLAAALVIAALLLFLTAGREVRRPLAFLKPTQAGDETRPALVTLALLLPFVLLLLLVALAGPAAVLPMLALGAALGCELSSPSPRSAFSVAHPMGWALALAATWLVSLLAAIGCGAFLDAARHMTIRLLLLGLLCLLTLPWLRSWSTRPTGRAASLLLGETAVAILLILLALF